MNTTPKFDEYNPEHITWDQFFDTYKPVKNHLDENASYNGCLYETYGEEADFIKTQDEPKIWTLVTVEGNIDVIVSGWHYVNRMGYFITEVPAPHGIEVYDDEDFLPPQLGDTVFWHDPDDEKCSDEYVVVKAPEEGGEIYLLKNEKGSETEAVLEDLELLSRA